MSKKKKIIIISLAVIVVGVIVTMNFMNNTSSATSVKVEEAKTRELTEAVSASGRIQPQTKVNITSEVTGEIIALNVKEGDYVHQGQLLIVLDTIQLQSDVDQARFAMTEIEARLNGAKVLMDQRKNDFDIKEKLFKDNHASEIEHDDAKFAYLNAVSTYEATQAQEKQYKSRFEKQLDYLSKAKIVAPMPGIITYLDCEVGEIAPAQNAFTQGTTLMTISNLEVDAFADSVFPGQVVEIGNTAIYASAASQEQSTNFRVKIIFQEAGVKIRPGMSATVDIITNKKENTVSVPYSAIVMRSLDIDSLEAAKAGQELASETEDSNSGSMVGTVQAADGDTPDKMKDEKEKKVEDIKGVFVIRDNKAMFVEVKTGIADSKNIEILSGIEVGDTVITGPYRALRSLKHEDLIEISKDNEKEGN